MTRIIPIVMGEGALSDAARARTASAEHAHDDHDHADGSHGSLPGQSPAYLRVAETPITEAEIAREMQHHRAISPHQSRAQAARALVTRELLRLETERLRIADNVEQVDAETLEEACIRTLIEREVTTPEPTEDACRRYFERNRDHLRYPDRLRVRHILLAATPSDSSARQRACQFGEELIAGLREHPERFTEFALRHSACPSRDNGGELGWIERGQTTPEFDRQLFTLKVGLAGLTVETRYGHHVVQLDEIERGAERSYDEAAGKIASYLETQVKQNAIHQYLQILQERYTVVGLDEMEAAA